MSEEDWIDMTHLASKYEQQLNTRTGRHRYRLRQLPSMSRSVEGSFDEMHCDLPWEPGLPPDAEPPKLVSDDKDWVIVYYNGFDEVFIHKKGKGFADLKLQELDGVDSEMDIKACFTVEDGTELIVSGQMYKFTKGKVVKQ